MGNKKWHALLEEDKKWKIEHGVKETDFGDNEELTRRRPLDEGMLFS